MGGTETKAFRNGNSTAVRLPAYLRIAPGTRLSIEQAGDVLTIRPIHEREQVRRELAEMFDEIQAIWAAAGGPPTPEPREPIEFPERPGLYD